MTRTTLDLDPSVLEELRHRATLEGKSMGQVASELLARTVGEPAEPLRPLEWNSGHLGTPLVDLEDKEAVWRVLDGRSP
jgi:hypothetical protein